MSRCAGDVYNARMRLVAALAIAVALGGCFPPDLGDGVVACGYGDSCPPRYFCHGDKHCYKTPPAVFDFAGLDFTNCMRVTCGAMCGITIPDGCGGSIDCPAMCPTGQMCGVPVKNLCGCATQVSCLGKDCGTMPDGCGGVISCGTSCPAGETCGGGGATGTANKCASGVGCTPKTCRRDKDCGLISDGCSAVLNCPDCPVGKTCGGGGPNLCG
jgi:hypothetical protein